ncbi:MAG TPA: phosphatidylglycerophosphatase A [Blastocatellia bacterium]|nr:phosphatidylglycerophosphatase A [Blastocatellia bacterium]
MTQAVQTASPPGLIERIGLLIATGIGAGYSPAAPGTIGSIEGVVIFIAITAGARRSGLGPEMIYAVTAVVAATITLVGIWAAGLYSSHSGMKDPQQIVIDEVAGQIITLVPIAGSPSVSSLIIGFILFRAFDIAKPYPVGRLERLPGGKGVVLDDVMAGVYAGVLLLASRLLQIA